MQLPVAVLTEQSAAVDGPLRTIQAAAAVVPLAGDALAGVSVLIVDDEADTRDLVAEVLSQHGAEVRAARSASEGRALLKQWTPDVIVSDVGMPEELLHHSQVCPTVEQMRRAAVPERVRVRGRDGPAIDDATDVARAQPVAAVVAEQCRARVGQALGGLAEAVVEGGLSKQPALGQGGRLQAWPAGSAARRQR